MKPDYSNKYRHKYRNLGVYFKKQLCTKVRKNFMSDKEFLGIYNLYINANTKEDITFIINIIRTSKVFKHYNTNIIYCNTFIYRMSGTSLFAYLNYIFINNNHADFNVNSSKALLAPVIEWLFSHTIHTNSLNSVSFK